ncbi:MAG: hypothetical protein ACREAF_02270 [Nitrosopumilaceae archaeon]
MSALEEGYVCAPYLHNHNSIELKDSWAKSEHVDDMYFVTATFSEDGGAYFPSRTNHYLLARFKNSKKMIKEVEKYKQDEPAFVFTMDGELFQRDTDGRLNFVSVYYLEYSQDDDDIRDVATIIARRDKVRRAGIAHLDLSAKENPKFTFPYNKNLVILEVSSGKSHQSDNKYCEKTRRDIGRKGITMTNLFSLSVLEKLK